MDIIIKKVFLFFYLTSISSLIITPSRSNMSIIQRHAPTQRSKLPPCTPRCLLMLAVPLTYMVVTFYVIKLQHSCPSTRDINTNLRHTNQLVNGSVRDHVGVSEHEVGRPNEETHAEANSMSDDVNEMLSGDYSPSTVYYVWCGSNRLFEFHHYLSVMSVIRGLSPDNIVFLYDTHPARDSSIYNTWFDELKDAYPFFLAKQLDNAKGDACLGHAKVNPRFVYKLLTEHGGMYISEYTLLDRLPVGYRNYSILNGLDVNTMEGLLMAKKGFPGTHANSLDEFVRRKDERGGGKTIRCTTSPTEYVAANHTTECILLPKEAFYPKDIWDLDTSFGRLTRRLLYGNPEIRHPRQSYDELVPNIAHMVWIGGGEMDFLFYLSMLSLIYVAEVDMVYLHGDYPPSGPYWRRIRDHPRITLIHRDIVERVVYGNTVNNIGHFSDIWRVDLMVKYGGIYIDTDAIFVRKLDTDIRSYEAVGSYDWSDKYKPYPDIMNFGVAIGKRHAPYWREFQKSMKWFRDDDFGFNSLRQSYRIKERHPEMLKIEPRLQVICYLSLCHPTWYPNYRQEAAHHLSSNPITDWRSDMYTLHFTYPTPSELLSEESLLRSNESMFAEIGRFILEKAGLLDQLKRTYNWRGASLMAV